MLCTFKKFIFQKNITMHFKNGKLTLLAIRYLTLIGEMLAQDLRGIDWNEEIEPRNVLKAMESCFDRVEHIAQYALEEEDRPTDGKWKLQNLIKDIEWLLAVIHNNHALFAKGLRRGKTRPSQEEVEALLSNLKASHASIA
jgi:hypothetical protein